MSFLNEVKVTRGGDELSYQEMLAAFESEAFNAFLARLDKMIEAERGRCEQSADPESWRQAQGALRALRTARALPGQLLKELGKK